MTEPAVAHREPAGSRLPATSTRSEPSAYGLLALQRLAGNQAVVQHLHRGAKPQPTMAGRAGTVATASSPAAVQRDAPADGAAPAASDVDGATFPGFSAWVDGYLADADDACADATGVSNGLPGASQGRLRQLVAGIVSTRNLVDQGKVALAAGQPAPALTADARGLAQRAETDLQTLHDVTEAWQAVAASGLFELVAAVGRAQLAEAQGLPARLAALQTRMRELQRIASGKEMFEAFGQVGLNATLTGAGMVVLAVAAPSAPLVLGVGVLVTVFQLGVDQWLGVGGPDAKTGAAAAVSVGGTVSTAVGVAKDAARLQAWGGRVGNLGAAMGSIIDGLEAHDSVQRYQTVRAQVIAVSQEMTQISRAMDRLDPVLRYPQQARQLVAGLTAQAGVLREHGQLILANAGQ